MAAKSRAGPRIAARSNALYELRTIARVASKRLVADRIIDALSEAASIGKSR
jgi:hypothetical protein